MGILIMKIKERVIKMLTICITKTSLNFENLTDEMYDQLSQDFVLDLKSDEEENSYYYEDKPEYLYNLLYKLSCKYDIELI